VRVGSRSAILSSLKERDREFIEALSLVREARASVELIVVGTFLGELTASELETLWPRRVPPTPALLRAAAAA
jgi:hypothetical protein